MKQDIRCEKPDCNCKIGEIEETMAETRIYIQNNHHSERHEQAIVVKKKARG